MRKNKTQICYCNPLEHKINIIYTMKIYCQKLNSLVEIVKMMTWFGKVSKFSKDIFLRKKLFSVTPEVK